MIITFKSERDSKYLLILILIFSVSFLIAKVASSNSLKAPQDLSTKVQWCLKSKKCISLEVAKTQKEQEIGLMHRPYLPIQTGMLFKMSEARKVDFWMRNTLVPLDMIFIYKDIVLEIKENLPICINSPCPIYSSSYKVDSIIELGSGETKRLGIKKGDIVDIH